jgi:hypothetical protein
MTIEIRDQDGYFDAMGHRVAENHGGVNELKRRCLETLSRLNEPPDEIRFYLLGSAALCAVPDVAHDPDPPTARQGRQQGRARR